MEDGKNGLLKDRKIVVGVCGGIAAYKAVEVVSSLIKLGAEVDVIMTENAARFVGPLTFRAITHRPVVTDMFEEPESWDIKHISLARKAELMLIAPATANILGKAANGIADDMLSTTLLAARCPLLFVPAMNTAMYENPVVRQNIRKLAELGHTLMEPGTGRLAEGTSGKGRLPEPAEIVAEACRLLNRERDLEGKRVLVTAGPTREPIDPVRYISNRSSGKMGYAIARAASERGASVKLISGPVAIPEPANVDVTAVVTAESMYHAVMESYEEADVIVMVAAVADYRCESVAGLKIKKSDEEMVLRLAKNRDILAELGKVKGSRILVGACAETDHLLENAQKKIAAKNLDMIIANDVTMEGAGFEADTNIIRIVHRDGPIVDLPKMSKYDAAHRILDEIHKYCLED